ncbi:MAG: hypothetical protein IT580_11910 [Verrucomicrobiales bacterium]|nr:hypothetical protein [Verrucomicrobiales bacterium]
MSDSEATSMGREQGQGAVAWLAAAMGVWLALLQFAYFFLLEVRLSSRATSFFVALFFWLAGFLVGLNVRSPRVFVLLLPASLGAYYVARQVLGLFPYRLGILPVVGVCIAVSGALAGAFFPYLARRFLAVKWLLFHENNGFVVGLLLTLFGSVFAGRFFLDWAPVLGAVPVLALAWNSRERSLPALACQPMRH